jgi:hypothetical protein
MKNYVKIENDIIVDSIVVDENDLPARPESELWIVIDENTFSIGDFYDKNKKAFYVKQTYPTWVLNPKTLEWEPPVPNPNKPEGKQYVWSEEAQKWLYTGISIDTSFIPIKINEEEI